MGSLIASRLAKSSHALATRAISQVPPTFPFPMHSNVLDLQSSVALVLDRHANLGVDYLFYGVDLMCLCVSSPA